MFGVTLKNLLIRSNRVGDSPKGQPPRIPNIIHFCYGFLPDAEFSFLQYLAIKSACEINRPARLFLHYQHECPGPWWQKAKQLVTPNRVEAPSEIHGRPLHHYAHRCDVLRLMMLHEHGGIYLDVDTLCVRPFTGLLGQQCVLGKQTRLHGLCNAVILSEPRGAFVSAWLDSYRTFRSRGHDDYWDEHAVRIPSQMARDRHMRRHLTVLNERSFFFPLWNKMHYLFESEDEDWFRPSFCIHYWESITRGPWLSKITPENAAAGNSNFARFVRRVL